MEFLNKLIRVFTYNYFISAVFTFLPFFLIAYPFEKGGKGLTLESYWSEFISYWQAGELTLPLLSSCGALLAVLISRRRGLNGGFFVINLIFAAIIMISSSFVLSESQNFTIELSHSGLMFCVICYALTNVLLVVTSFFTDEIDGAPNGDERAVNLLREKRKIVGSSEVIK